jgi:Zn-finger nucleic acid-binding protein
MLDVEIHCTKCRGKKTVTEVQEELYGLNSIYAWATFAKITKSVTCPSCKGVGMETLTLDELVTRLKKLDENSPSE